MEAVTTMASTGANGSGVGVCLGTGGGVASGVASGVGDGDGDSTGLGAVGGSASVGSGASSEVDDDGSDVVPRRTSMVGELDTGADGADGAVSRTSPHALSMRPSRKATTARAEARARRTRWSLREPPPWGERIERTSASP